MVSSQQIINQTKKWINDVVVGCNFCPFAANVINKHSVHYQVEMSSVLSTCLDSFLNEIHRLDNEKSIETIFLIFPDSYEHFDDYLDLVLLAEKLLKQNGYEGIYQVASFHPLYRFANSSEKDAANYTNRSVYPMLHLLREKSIDRALEKIENPEKIPDRNIIFAREKGLTYMQELLNACIK